MFWKTTPVKQSIVTLDLEGVLVPEIWIAVAEKMANMMNTFDSFMGSGSSRDDLLG